jgi:predicted MFS family arabinose efflux permease
VGQALANPSLSALLSRMAKKDDQGGTMGIGESASALGRIIGPESGTFSYVHVSTAAPYVGGGLFMLVATAVAVTLRKAQPDDGAPAAPRGA